MSEPYMVKQTLTYSDGTETVLNYTPNKDAAPIEEASAEMVEANLTPEEIVETPEEIVIDEEL